VKKLLIGILALAATAAFGAEGMWMPQQIPSLAAELKKAGLKIDANRFADLTGDPMGAVISLGGCSASFVSPDGLVVTNHHCGFGALQFNSTPQRDLITNGFLAKTRDEELPAGPGSRIFVTTNITRPVGTESQFAILLADKTPVLRGWCIVFEAWADANNPYNRPGMRLGSVPASATAATERLAVVVYPTSQELSVLLGEPLLDYELLLDDAAPDGFVRDWRAPGLAIERHLAYAGQWFLLGLGGAVLLHALWNGSLAFADDAIGLYFTVQVPIFIGALLVTVYLRRQEARITRTRLAEYGAAGWFSPAEVEMLARLGATVVGMSLVPESLPAHALGLRVLGICSLTNAFGDHVTHEDVLRVSNTTAAAIGRLLVDLLPRLPSEGA